MSRFTKYKLYQKYEEREGQSPIPCYPNVFSIDGDGTQTPYIVEENSRDCGYTGDTQPIYRWYNMPITSYYVCDECDSQAYENQYLTLVARGSGAFKKVGHSETFQYSTDKGSTWINATSATSISVNNGSRVMFKGNLTPIDIDYATSGEGVGWFSASTQFEAEGNPMSLLFGDNFRGQTSLVGKKCAFAGLFGWRGLVGIDNLKLVATTLEKYCYMSMFMGCTSLTSVPSDLLPTTTLAFGCYSAMFYGCTSLTTAPNLLATTLVQDCYGQMFQDCSSLNYVKCLATTNVGVGTNTSIWLADVSSTGTFVKASSANWPRGENGIPEGWTIQNA